MNTDADEGCSVSLKGLFSGSTIWVLAVSTPSIRERVSEKDRVVGELREEVARLETRFREADARAKAAVEDNVRREFVCLS